jgi:hypothetical protein
MQANGAEQNPERKWVISGVPYIVCARGYDGDKTETRQGRNGGMK